MLTHVDDVTSIMPEVKHRADVWYMLGEVTYCTHVGTHVEVPFHHQKDGADTAEFPVHKLVGDLVVLDFTDKKDQDEISLEEIRARGAKIKRDDIVFIRTGMDKYFRSDRWMEQPHLSIDANIWLIGKGIACLGTDGAGLEIPGTDYQPNHQAIFKANIPMVESATNLHLVQEGNWTVFILPLPIEGLDASPVQMIAIRKEDLR